jgi:Fe2+ or Zn2+ uptake regulation protein
MNVQQLKDELRQRGVKVTNQRKADLQKLLKEAVKESISYKGRGGEGGGERGEDR